MGVLVVLVIIIGGIFWLTQNVRKGNFKKQIENEANALHDYVVRKCERSGMDSQEARRTADNYAEDFKNECSRQINMTWGNVLAVKRAITVIRTELTSEIDARLR